MISFYKFYFYYLIFILNRIIEQSDPLTIQNLLSLKAYRPKETRIYTNV